jgi:diguanylate cyclase (GGDEF)-like protein
MFKLLRHATVVSFFSIGIAAVLLGLGYRALAERDMVELTHSLHNELADMLVSSGGYKAITSQSRAAPVSISRLFGGYPPLSLIRVNAYDVSGRLIYASEEPRIAQEIAKVVVASREPHGISELVNDPGDAAGGIVVSLIALPPDSPLGVLELQSNVGQQLDKIARTQRELVTAAILALGVLYGVMLLIVVRGDKLIKQVSSQNMSIEGQLKKLSRYDTLTGLPSRDLFRQRLHDALVRAKRERTFLAVLVFELKTPDGVQVAGPLYESVAKRLVEVVRKSDTVSRLGTDFAILLEEIPNRNTVSEVSEKIMHALREEFDVGNRKVRIESRVGISLFPVDATNEDMLLRGAELALKHAKQANRSVAYYQPKKMLLTDELARRTDFPVVGEVLK